MSLQGMTPVLYNNRSKNLVLRLWQSIISKHATKILQVGISKMRVPHQRQIIQPVLGQLVPRGMMILKTRLTQVALVGLEFPMIIGQTWRLLSRRGLGADRIGNRRSRKGTLSTTFCWRRK